MEVTLNETVSPPVYEIVEHLSRSSESQFILTKLGMCCINTFLRLDHLKHIWLMEILDR